MIKAFFKKTAYLLISMALIFSLLSLVVFRADATLRFNPVAAIALGVLVLILILTERKFGYFASIVGFLRGERDCFRAHLRDGKPLLFLWHLLSTVATVLAVGTVSALLLMGYFSKAAIFLVFFETLVAVVLQLVDRIASGRGAEPAKLFLIITVLVGIMMCYTMPPSVFVAWDDETHFGRAYDTVFLWSQERPWSVTDILIHKGFPGAPFIEDPQAFVADVLDGSDVPVEFHPRLWNPYTALGYTPMMLALAFLSLLGADLVKILVLCRIANLVAYACVIYHALRRLKSGAMIFSAVCLLPSALFLAGSLSYDFWLTAWIAYGFAYLISILQCPEKKIRPIDMAVILISLFVGCGPKAIYCFVLLPLFFLGKKHFETPAHAKKFRLWTAVTIGVILATLVVPGLIVPDLYTDHRGGADVSTAGQISFILSNPFKYAYILLKFLSEYCSLTNMNSFSTFYAYLGNGHVFFGTISAFLLLYCTFTDRKKDDGYELMQPTRWATLAACFIQLVFIATSLYVGFTPVGLENINGCQYRYIFPLLGPFCFFMAPKKIKCEINPKFQAAFVYGGLAFNLMASFFNVYISKFIG